MRLKQRLQWKTQHIILLLDRFFLVDNRGSTHNSLRLFKGVLMLLAFCLGYPVAGTPYQHTTRRGWHAEWWALCTFAQSFIEHCAKDDRSCPTLTDLRLCFYGALHSKALYGYKTLG